MEIEDFDEDDAGTPLVPARERGPLGRSELGPGMRASPGDNFRNRGPESFGLVSEMDGGGGLASGMQRLGLQDTPQQPLGGFGLEAEVNPPAPASRVASGSLGRGGALQPLMGPGLGGLGALAGPRRGPVLGPLPPSTTPPPRLQQESFGLVAETEVAPAPGPPPAAGSRLPTAAPAGFGLASEMAELPQPAPLQPDLGSGGGLGLGSNFGLDSDVRAAAAAGRLPGAETSLRPPAGGFGLEEEIADKDAQAGAAAAAAATVRMPGAYGLEAEVAKPPPPPLPAPGGPLGPGDYGLDSETAWWNEPGRQPQHRSMQDWSAAVARTLSLADLQQFPEDQRWLEFNAAQAERTIRDLDAQLIPHTTVDILEVREKLKDASVPPRLAYLAAVERATPEHRLPLNCRPSLLQTKLKAGQNRLRKLVEPVLDPGSQGFVDLSYAPNGALQPEMSRVWQFGLSLVRADGVGKTGLQRVRQPCLFIARLALFDRRANRFLGNVLGVRPDAVSNYDKRWEFNSDEQVIVRCSCVQSDPQAGTRLVTDDALSVFVEFNTSYRLSVEDTVFMPQNEDKSSKVLDEINTCWAMISFKNCLSLQREVQISVPLYFGSIYDPKPMTAFYAEKRSKTPLLSALKPKESPVLQFRVGPLGLGKPPLVPYAYMPTTMLATHDLGTALAAYRMSLALTLARQSGPFAAVADPVLSGFPPLLSDHHLLAEFLTRWRDLTNKMTAIIDTGCCSPDVLPPLSAMVEAFRRCAIELAPLAHCPTIPPRHINNFVEYQGHRLRLVQHYCHVLDPRTNKILGARHPVEPLSHAGFEFLHAPFDVSEIRVCMADRLERPEPFYRH